MAELLERRLLHLKAKLDDLKRSYASQERPVDVDVEIETIEDQIRGLSGFGSQNDRLN